MIAELRMAVTLKYWEDLLFKFLEDCGRFKQVQQHLNRNFGYVEVQTQYLGCVNDS